MTDSPLPPTPQRVLVVDDDKEIVRVLRAYLEQAGYGVFTAHDGGTALHILLHERPQVVLLDVMMPGKDGLEVTRAIRANPATAGTYILMVTARIEDTDKVVGLELGADDYVTKPFNPREIVARIRATFRRLELSEGTPEKVFFYRELMLDAARHKVTMAGKVIDLTPTEFNLLSVLMQRPGYPFTRADLVQKRLGYDYETLERTLDSHIRNLRKKIEPDQNAPIYIQTVYGVGYRLGEP